MLKEAAGGLQKLKSGKHHKKPFTYFAMLSALDPFVTIGTEIQLWDDGPMTNAVE